MTIIQYIVRLHTLEYCEATSADVVRICWCQSCMRFVCTGSEPHEDKKKCQNTRGVKTAESLFALLPFHLDITNLYLFVKCHIPSNQFIHECTRDNPNYTGTLTGIVPLQFIWNMCVSTRGDSENSQPENTRHHHHCCIITDKLPWSMPTTTLCWTVAIHSTIVEQWNK